jgi:hypothetical protein
MDHAAAGYPFCTDQADTKTPGNQAEKALHAPAIGERTTLFFNSIGPI